MRRPLAITAALLLCVVTCSPRPSGTEHTDTAGSTAVVMQSARSDCGLAVLATMLSVLGKPTTLAEIGAGVDVPERGLSMAQLQRLALQRSVRLEGVRDRQKRVDRWEFPWVAHMAAGTWEHYVLVEDANSQQVTLADPAVGRVKVEVPAFVRLWSGRALVIVARPD